MNTTETRQQFYAIARTQVDSNGVRHETSDTVGSDVELDYLDTNLYKLDLSTIDVFTVTAATQHRPDLISFRYFGTYNMWWLISMHNDFIDGVWDYEIGKDIRIPSKEEYTRFYNVNALR